MYQQSVKNVEGSDRAAAPWHLDYRVGSLVLRLKLILGSSDCGSIVPIVESRLGQPSHSGHDPKFED